MEDRYVTGDDRVSFPVMVRARDDGTCKTDTRSNTQFQSLVLSSHKVIVYLVWQRCYAYTNIGGPRMTIGW